MSYSNVPSDVSNIGLLKKIDERVVLKYIMNQNLQKSSGTGSLIHKLSPVVIDRIAAGEVIEGPHSVVKELVENSVDAGARSIVISTDRAGMSSIIIEDDGDGIRSSDLPLSVERHATSKIEDLDDIEQIFSYGFRGEALASIAAVSHLEIRSRHISEQAGGFLESRGGEMIRCEPAAVNGGTVISVRELFYAVPARKKFIKSERIENTRIHQQILRMAIANPGIRFLYHRDGKEILNLSPVDGLLDRLSQIYRLDLQNRLIEVDLEAEGISLKGYISQPSYYRSNREGQYQFVNGRYVEFKNLPFLIKKTYGEMLPERTFPYFFLFIETDPGRVDVNVHPAKKEVRLMDEQLLNAMVIKSVERALHSEGPLTLSLMTDSMSGNDKSGKKPDVMRLDSSAFLFMQKTRREEQEHSEKHFENTDEPLTNIEMKNRQEYGEARIPVDQVLGVPDGNEGSHEKTSFEYTFKDGHSAGLRFGQSFSVKREIEDSLEENTGRFIPIRHFGVIFGTYILAEAEDGLYIIDQHTAHERINYERIKKNIKSMGGERQALLHPLTVRCGVDELDYILEKRDMLEGNGFFLEEFGSDAYIVREIPTYLDVAVNEEIVGDLIRRLVEKTENHELYDEYAALKACKMSIKRNDFISGEILSDILLQLSRCNDPTRCPHGRPTMIRITKDDLDRLFLRT